MQFQIPIKIDSPSQGITHKDKILLIGSCFTDHMSARLKQAKWQILANPNGTLFNPLSVADALESYIDNRYYEPEELFYWNELWQHWDFHSLFSNIDKDSAAQAMNHSITHAHDFVQSADWVIITLGSAFHYVLTHEAQQRPVSNCHRAPGQWFEKRLLPIDFIITRLQTTIQKLQERNPKIKVLFTISPVRHVRDGVTENNRSKARLIEAVHSLVELNESTYYFPAYELAIDVLRDYRFYDADMVHPNYACTTYIWEQFTTHFMTDEAQTAMALMKDIAIAYQHRTRFPETTAHQKFLKVYAQKIASIRDRYPYVDFAEELRYFNQID